jgi:FMN phosphatase YigB (HAD superfamily)
MIIIIDFDDTILNTKNIYKKLVSDVLSKFGISHRQFIETKEKIQEDWGGILRFYDIDRHSELMSKISGFSVFKIKDGILNFFETGISSFVFDDVSAFLKAHKSDRLILMTFGSKIVQESKVKGSGVMKYFDDIIFTEKKSKSEVLNSIFNTFLKNEKIVFIDDKIEELKKMKELYPEIICVRMKRKDGRYTKDGTPKGCFEIKNLKELDKTSI